MSVNMADYVGRTFDLVAYQANEPTGTGLLLADFGSGVEGGRLCTGIDKLWQRFVIKFLTPRGSVPYHPDEGCDFITELRSGQLTSPSDVFVAFAQATVLIADQLAEEDLATDPPDELFQSATLTAVAFIDQGVALSVRLVSQADTAAERLLPLSFSL